MPKPKRAASPSETVRKTHVNFMFSEREKDVLDAVAVMRSTSSSDVVRALVMQCHKEMTASFTPMQRGILSELSRLGPVDATALGKALAHHGWWPEDAKVYPGLGMDLYGLVNARFVSEEGLTYRITPTGQAAIV